MEWKDIRQRRERLFITMPIPCMDNIISCGMSINFMANVDNGTTIWEKRCADGLDISTLGTIFLCRRWFCLEGNIHTGQVDTLFFGAIYPYQSCLQIFLDQYTHILLFKNTKDSLIVITYCLGDSKSNQFDAYFLLYNISKPR